MRKLKEEKLPRSVEETQDIVEKEFLGFSDVAEDVFNVLLFAGKKVAKKEKLLAGPTESIYQAGEKLKNQLEDLCMYEMANGKVRLMYLIANQSRTDGKMLLRKAGYTGGVYRGQYEGRTREIFPVIEIVLYWGKSRWKSSRTFQRLFRKKGISEDEWKYIDEMKLHVFEMRHLPEETRKLFQSDMRIIADFLAEGKDYFSDRKIVHKAALIKMIKVLSGDTDIGEVEKWMREQGIREEDEVKVCELFDQYERRGRDQGRKEGEKLGMAKGEKLGIAKVLLDLLEEHGMLPDGLKEAIMKQADVSVLKTWLKLAAHVKSIDEFIQQSCVRNY